MNPRLLLVAILSLPAFWLPAAPEPAPKLDRHGDPLPDGAIARLGTVRFRDVSVGEAIVYSPDGTRIATASPAGVAIWDARTGRRLYALARPEVSAEEMVVFDYGSSAPLAFSPDGKYLAHRMVAGTVRLLALADGETRTIDLEGSPNGTLLFTPDGRHLVAIGDRFVRVVPVAGGRETQVWPIRPEVDTGSRFLRTPIFGRSALSPDGKVLAVVGLEVRHGRCGDLYHRAQHLHLWDVATGEELTRLDLAATQVAFRPDGSALAGIVGSEVVLLDPISGERVGGWEAPNGDGADTLAFSPDGTQVTAQGRLYDAATGEALRGVGVGLNLTFSPDGRHLATALEWNGAVAVRETLTGRSVLPFGAHELSLTDVHALPDGRSVATVSQDQTIRVWNARTGEPLRTIDFPARTMSAYALAGRWAASAGEGWLEIRDLETGRLVHRHKTSPGVVRLALSADGRTLLMHDNECGGYVQIRDVDTGRLRARVITGGELVALALSPDGATAATAIRGGVIQLWGTTRGIERAELEGLIEGEEAAFWRLAFSPDGRLLAASRDATGDLSLWDVKTGRLLRCGPGHGPRPEDEGVYRITALTFSADGRLLVTGGDDGTARAWETASLRERFRWNEPTQGIALVGRHLLAAMQQPTDALVRDLAGLADAAGPATPRDVKSLWTLLADDNPGKAYRAGRALTAMPEATLPLLREHLHPIQPIDPNRLRAWIAALDADDFEARDRAMNELARVGEPVVAALVAARRTSTSPEQCRRLDDLLRARIGPPHPDRLRAVRAIEVLEDIATAQARAVLESLAQGEPDAAETQHAKAALERLRGHP